MGRSREPLLADPGHFSLLCVQYQEVQPYFLSFRVLLLAATTLLGLAACDSNDPERGVPPLPPEDPVCTGAETPREGGSGRIPVTLERECSTNSLCNDGIFCNGMEVCRVREINSTFFRCECQPARTIPCDDERATCDEREDVCLFACDIPPDADGDGIWNIECGGSDCDDDDSNRGPNQTEVCDADGFDEDCDSTTFGEIDADEDGFFDAACFNIDGSGEERGGRDCDDGNAAVHPIQSEDCNGIDDDCDGDIDEGVRVQLYTDSDGDGFGTGSPQLGCAPAEGFAIIAGDCDDSRATLHPDAIRCDTSNPQINDAIEICGSNGTWVAGTCDGRRVCIPQPDGTGVCI